MKLNTYIITGLFLLILGLSAGWLSGLYYAFPDLHAAFPDFRISRSLHTFWVIFFIFSVALGSVYQFSLMDQRRSLPEWIGKIQLALWIASIIGISAGLLNGSFQGKEYWEGHPAFGIPLVLAQLIGIFRYIYTAPPLKEWPVYRYMWLSGHLFFLYTFLESFAWLHPDIFQDPGRDITIQWKAGGALVGAWNQLVYGAGMAALAKWHGGEKAIKSPIAYAIFFLGLTNLMFNWGHHLYPAPSPQHVKMIGYVVSMTEWVLWLRMMWLWKKTSGAVNQSLSVRYLLLADNWVFLQLFQALFMSIPLINVYTHGTWITVAHAMGTTIGINTMLLFGIISGWIYGTTIASSKDIKWLKASQIFLSLFWLSLITMGWIKAYVLNKHPEWSHSQLMDFAQPVFYIFFISGTLLFISLLRQIVIFIQKGRDSVSAT